MRFFFFFIEFINVYILFPYSIIFFLYLSWADRTAFLCLSLWLCGIDEMSEPPYCVETNVSISLISYYSPSFEYKCLIFIVASFAYSNIIWTTAKPASKQAHAQKQYFLSKFLWLSPSLTCFLPFILDRTSSFPLARLSFHIFH